MFKKSASHNPAAQPGSIHWSLQLLILLAIAFIIRTFIYGLYQVPTGSMETTILVGERFVADKFTVWFKKPQRGEIIAFNDPTYEYSKNPIKNLFERYVWGPANWTKRVIGVPGDHVQGKIEDGKPVVYVNDKKLDEPYLNKYPLIGVFREDPSELGDDQKRSYDTRSFDSKISCNDQPFYRLNPRLIVYENNSPKVVYPATPLPDNRDVFDVKLGENEYWAMGDNRLGSWDSRGWGKLDGKQIHGKIIFRLFSFDSSESWWIVDLIKHPIDFWKRVRWGRCMQRVS